MALRLIEVQTETSGDLPFLNKLGTEFVALVGTNWFIREIIVCETGYLVITAKFKAFIFKDSTMFGFLKQALEVWTTKQEPSYPLFAEVLQTKKITLAVDDEALDSFWTVNGFRFLQSQSPLELDGSAEETGNPLLPPTTVVPISKRRKRESSTAMTEQIGH